MKRHYAQTEVRLIEGANATAACGATVPNAVFPFFLDISAGVLDTVTLGNSLLDCQECVRKMFSATAGRRYIHALIPGEAARHDEVA